MEAELAMNSMEKKYEKVTRLIERIVSSSKDGITIIVEGPRDRDALRALGVEGTILCVKGSPEGLPDFLETLRPSREVMVLTDFDGEGRALAYRLIEQFSSMKVKSNDVVWRQLKGLAKSDIRSIEELVGYYEKLRSEQTRNPHGWK